MGCGIVWAAAELELKTAAARTIPGGFTDACI